VTNRTYRLYPKAIEYLENLYAYSLQTFGRPRTKRYIKHLEQTFVKALHQPELSRSCDLVQKSLKAINAESHVVFFKETTQGIIIIRILHKAMDHSRHLNALN